MAGKMDREEAAAFLHDSTPWKDMDDAARKNWQKRANTLLDQGYRHEDLAQFQGCARSTVSEHLAWSKAQSESDADTRTAATRKRAEQHVRKMVREDPDFVIDVVSKTMGENRRPQNVKAKVDEIFGPFVQYNAKAQDLIRTLPDFIPGDDVRESAERAVTLSEAVAQTVNDWLRGNNVADEVESFLKEAAS